MNNQILEQKRLRLNNKASSLEELSFFEECSPLVKAGQGVIVEVKSAGINPSDVKAALGLMPHAVWPRTPGRDYAGVVVDGPREMIGLEVWGSGGELGIREDGSHARYISLNTAAVRRIPLAVSMLEAGAVGVPFITAFEGLRRAGGVKDSDVVLVFGGNGKVGQAVIQIATRAGAHVIAVERGTDIYCGTASSHVKMIDGTKTDVAEFVRDNTQAGANIVYNTVGSPYFGVANKSMAVGATQIFISTIDRAVPFDIFTFFRGQHSYVGIDTLSLDSVHCAKIFDELDSGFEDGTLRPFPVEPSHIYNLENAAEGYRRVLAGAGERLVIQPS